MEEDKAAAHNQPQIDWDEFHFHSNSSNQLRLVSLMKKIF